MELEFQRFGEGVKWLLHRIGEKTVFRDRKDPQAAIKTWVRSEITNIYLRQRVKGYSNLECK